MRALSFRHGSLVIEIGIPDQMLLVELQSGAFLAGKVILSDLRGAGTHLRVAIKLPDEVLSEWCAVALSRQDGNKIRNVSPCGIPIVREVPDSPDVPVAIIHGKTFHEDQGMQDKTGYGKAEVDVGTTPPGVKAWSTASILELGLLVPAAGEKVLKSSEAAALVPPAGLLRVKVGPRLLLTGT